MSNTTPGAKFAGLRYAFDYNEVDDHTILLSDETTQIAGIFRDSVTQEEGIFLGRLFAASYEQNAALERVAAALAASSHSEKYVSEDDWNPDAHVEIVLTIADARAVYAAIAKAEGKVTG